MFSWCFILYLLYLKLTMYMLYCPNTDFKLLPNALCTISWHVPFTTLFQCSHLRDTFRLVVDAATNVKLI